MTIKLFSILFFITLTGFYADTTDFYPEKQAIKLVMKALGENEIELLEMVEVIENVQKNEPIVIYRFKRAKPAENFYTVFTQAKGRYDLFDYLIISGDDFVVEKIQVLKYRSEHGGEIASKKWLEQFENYSSGELRYGKEISALSGATVSANSITADVPKVLEILKESCK